MSIRHWVLRWLTRGSALASIYAVRSYARASTNDAELAYRKIVWIYRSVRSIATNLQQIPVYAVQQVPGRGRNRVQRLNDKHPLSQLIQRPNDEDDFSAIVEATSIQLNLRGEALWELVSGPEDREGARRPARIFVAPSKWISEVKLTPEGAYEYFKLRGEGQEKKIEGKDAVFFKFYNPADPWRGLAPLDAAWQSADMHYAAQLYNAWFFDHGAIPAMALKVDYSSGRGKLTDEQRARLREEFQRIHAGVEKAHNIAVLGPGESIDKIGSDLKDMNFETLMRYSEREILAAYGVPPILAGIVEDANRANSIEQRRTFWEETVIPQAEDMATLINRKITPRFGLNLSVVFDYMAVPAMRKDLKALSDSVGPLICAGVYTINEVRTEMLDKPPVPWGDQWWHPGDEMPSGTPGTDADEARALISPQVALKMLGEWKNAILARLREGAKTPIEAFPCAREAQKAARKFGLPRKAAWELARAVYLDLALNWDEIAPTEAVAELFERHVRALKEGTKGTGGSADPIDGDKDVDSKA